MAPKRRPPKKKLLTWKRWEQGGGYRTSLDSDLDLVITRTYDMWELRLMQGFFGAHIDFGSLQWLKQRGEKIARNRLKNKKDWWL